jgi:hypothetical protein
MLCTKKPIQVEMMCWDGTNLDEIQAWGRDLVETERARALLLLRYGSMPGTLNLFVRKGQSECVLEVGDWIALESDGDGYYPVARGVFAATYEDREETSSRPPIRHVPSEMDVLRSMFGGRQFDQDEADEMCAYLQVRVRPPRRDA